MLNLRPARGRGGLKSVFAKWPTKSVYSRPYRPGYADFSRPVGTAMTAAERRR